MPDGDVFTRTLARGWRKPARLTNAMADAERVARAQTMALAQTLIEACGCPGLADIMSTLQAVERQTACVALGGGSQDASVISDTFRCLDGIVAAADGHKHTRFAVEAARAAVVRLIESAEEQSDTAGTITERLCWHIINHYGFDAQRVLLMGTRFATYEEAQEWQAEVSRIMAPRVAVMAQALESDPTGQSVRKPRWPRPVKAMADILATTVVVGPAGDMS